jgi:MFS family permease
VYLRLFVDLLFSISNVVITNSFPPMDQALAGGIFNTVSQLGNSIGLAVTAIVASAVTSTAGNEEGTTPTQATLDGYRAAFWTRFAAAIVSCFISTIGLRKSGKVGLKRE